MSTLTLVSPLATVLHNNNLACGHEPPPTPTTPPPGSPKHAGALPLLESLSEKADSNGRSPQYEATTVTYSIELADGHEPPPVPTTPPPPEPQSQSVSPVVPSGNLCVLASDGGAFASVAVAAPGRMLLQGPASLEREPASSVSGAALPRTTPTPAKPPVPPVPHPKPKPAPSSASYEEAKLGASPTMFQPKAVSFSSVARNNSLTGGHEPPPTPTTPPPGSPRNACWVSSLSSAIDCKNASVQPGIPGLARDDDLADAHNPPPLPTTPPPPEPKSRSKQVLFPAKNSSTVVLDDSEFAPPAEDTLECVQISSLSMQPLQHDLVITALPRTIPAPEKPLVPPVPHPKPRPAPSSANCTRKEAEGHPVPPQTTTPPPTPPPRSDLAGGHEPPPIPTTPPPESPKNKSACASSLGAVSSLAGGHEPPPRPKTPPSVPLKNRNVYLAVSSTGSPGIVCNREEFVQVVMAVLDSIQSSSLAIGPVKEHSFAPSRVVPTVTCISATA